MPLTFPNDYFISLRRNQAELANESSYSQAYSMLSDEFLDTFRKDQLHELADFMVVNGLIDEERRQRVTIDELTAKISDLQPAVRRNKSGVYVVIGQAGTGKSTWVRSILDSASLSDNSILLSHDEPSLSSDLMGTSRGMDELLHCFDVIKSNDNINVIALDGIRTIQYEAVGNTLSGGVNSGFFRFLTDASNAAVESGVVCLFIYNPNTEKDETYNLVSAMVEGSVQGVINLNDKTIVSRYHGRVRHSLESAMSIIFDEHSSDASLISNKTNFDHSQV